MNVSRPFQGADVSAYIHVYIIRIYIYIYVYTDTRRYMVVVASNGFNNSMAHLRTERQEAHIHYAESVSFDRGIWKVCYRTVSMT